MSLVEGYVSLLNEFILCYKDLSKVDKIAYRCQYKRCGGKDRYKVIELIHILVELNVAPNVRFEVKLSDAIDRVNREIGNMTLTRHDRIVSKWSKDRVMKYCHWILFTENKRCKASLFDIIKLELYKRKLVK